MTVSLPLCVILAITEAGKVGGHLTKTFFRVEYALNYFTGKLL